MKFLDRVDKIKKEKVKKRGIVAVAVAVGMMMFGGCASIVYFNAASQVPDESPSVPSVSAEGSMVMSGLQPCFAATSMDFAGLGYFGEEGGPLVLLLWSPFFVVDLPISFCTDILTMPWQISRYRRVYYPAVSAVRSAMVPELLRGLKDLQSKDGYFYSGGNELTSTALVVLAFLAHGDMTYHVGEFGVTCKKAFDYIVSCADTGGESIRFKGEEQSPQAFFAAADAIVTEYGLTRSPGLREIAEKCVARTMREVEDIEAALVVEAKFDKQVAAAKLRWAVMTLHNAKVAGLTRDGLDSSLADAKRILARCGESDNGYYDVWKLYRRVWVEGPTGEKDYDEWSTVIKEKKTVLRKSVRVVGSVKDSEGTWRWKSRACPCNGGIWASGLGNVADTALAILQVTWPVSHKLPPKNGYKDDAKKGEAPPVEVEI